MWFPPPTFWLSWIILHKYSCTCFYVDCVLDAEIILWIPGAIDRGHRCPPGTGGWESHRSPFSGPVGCHCSELSHVLTVTWQAWQHVKPNLGFSPPPPPQGPVATHLPFCALINVLASNSILPQLWTPRLPVSLSLGQQSSVAFWKAFLPHPPKESIFRKIYQLPGPYI